ncbi:MAG: hypothetical protein V1806_12620 [Pseudomonadota bacterium]
MEPDRTCKRCSVARVNSLCQAYQQAHSSHNALLISALRQISEMVKGRGYDAASVLLMPGLNEKDLRAHCWNISSFLRDQEVEAVLGGL